MKFSLKLDESLFDEEFESDVPSRKEIDSAWDDDFSMDYDQHIENIPSGPAAGADTGVAGELIALINDEWEAIQGYNNAIAALRAVMSENPFYADAVRVLEEISAEENAHVGQLQEVLKHISPNASEINNGVKEAQSQLVNGVLPVQSWEASSKQTPVEDPTVEQCSITDIDDEM